MMVKDEKLRLPDTTFTMEDLDGVIFPHSDPLVITVEIDQHKVHRVLADTGAGVIIIYKHAYDRMMISSTLIPSSVPITGFTGEEAIPLGKLHMPAKIEDAHGINRIVMQDFYVMEGDSPYNVILGRKFADSVWAVPSPLHQTFLFLDEQWRVGRVRDNQETARICAVRVKEPPAPLKRRPEQEIVDERIPKSLKKVPDNLILVTHQCHNDSSVTKETPASRGVQTGVRAGFGYNIPDRVIIGFFVYANIL